MTSKYIQYLYCKLTDGLQNTVLRTVNSMFPMLNTQQQQQVKQHNQVKHY